MTLFTLPYAGVLRHIRLFFLTMLFCDTPLKRWWKGARRAWWVSPMLTAIPLLALPQFMYVTNTSKEQSGELAKSVAV